MQGIAGHGYYDNCTVPIIENTARECELTDRLRQAIKDYPKSQAVLVRRHGVYVWGSTWIQAKTQAECYDYLFEAALKMKAAVGIDASQPAGRAPAAATNGMAQNGHAHGKSLCAANPPIGANFRVRSLLNGFQCSSANHVEYTSDKECISYGFHCQLASQPTMQTAIGPPRGTRLAQETPHRPLCWT